MSSVSRSVGRPVTRSVLAGQLNNLTQLIKSIFATGEQGVAYDPNDLTTPYQDAAGTIPVTAAGQSVGLILDKSKGLALGDELAPSNLLGWGAYGTPSNITTTSFEASTAGNGLRLTGLVVGKTYKVSASGSGNCTLVAENVGTIYSQTIKDCIFTATATSLVLRATTTGKVTVERFSLKSLAGNHAYQAVSASRPILQQTPILGNEVVSDTTFNDPSYWLLTGTGWSITGGKAVATNATGSVSRTGLLKPNTTYDFVIRVLREAGSINLPYDGQGPNIQIASQSGTYTRRLTTSQYINFTAAYGNNFTGTVEFVSAKEVTGYRTDQNYLKFDGVDDRITTTLPAQLTGCTVIRSVPNVGTQILTNQTIPTTYNDNIDNCGLIVINRALTASETIQITKLFNKAAGV